MISFVEAFDQIRSSVVGIGLRDDPKHTIIGTGFVAHPSGWVITNRHVVEALLQQTTDGRVGLRNGAAVYHFASFPPPPGMVAMTGFVISDIVEARSHPTRTGNGTPMESLFGEMTNSLAIPLTPPDLGICRFPAEELPVHFRQFNPVQIIHSKVVKVGTFVGILGFPQGLNFPMTFHSSANVQLSPLLQVGVVSGVLPFSGLENPEMFVLDIHVNPGSSGSPLFLPSGEVVGVVFATRQRWLEVHDTSNTGQPIPRKDLGVYVGTGLGLAVPACRFPSDWLADN